MKKNTNQRLIVYTYLYSWQRIILQLAIIDYKVVNGENINLYINQLAINETKYLEKKLETSIILPINNNQQQLLNYNYINKLIIVPLSTIRNNYYFTNNFSYPSHSNFMNHK